MCIMTTNSDERTLRSALTACGPVRISTDDLRDPRAFKHRDHPLVKHLEAYIAATGGPGNGAYELRDLVWENLVTEHLLDKLQVQVSLAAAAYNAAYARYVDGLTENDDTLEYYEVEIPALVIVDAFLAAAAGHRASVHEQASPARSSLPHTGLPALIGRRVEVSFLAPIEGLVGRCLAHHDDSLVLATGESNITAIPLHAIAYVSTWQCTAEEENALYQR